MTCVELPLTTSPISGIHGQDLEGCSQRGGCLILEPHGCITALCGWCGSVGSSSHDLQLAIERFAAECDAAKMKVSPSESEATVLREKSGVLPFGFEMGPCLKWRSLSISWSYCCVMDWGFVSSDDDAAPVRYSEKGAVLKGKAVDLLIHLHSNPSQWSWDLGLNQNNKIAYTSCWNDLPTEDGSAQPHTYGENLE